MNEIYTGKKKWIVIKQRHPDDDTSFDYRPTISHNSKPEAEMEAMRLAIKMKGHTFDVAKITESITATTLLVKHHS